MSALFEFEFNRIEIITEQLYTGDILSYWRKEIYSTTSVIDFSYGYTLSSIFTLSIIYVHVSCLYIILASLIFSFTDITYMG